jgi:CubicO group peptidase (beta-lactamase class C family)
MINRRDALKALAGCGVLAYSSTALAQSPSKRSTKTKKKKSTAPTDQSLQSDTRVEDVLGPIRDEYHLPGLIGAISFGARLVAIGALGIRKIGSSQPLLVTDQMHLGSCTKAMTATMIGSLVEEGKLSWRSTFKEIFPEVADQFHPQFQEAKLSHLLTHRAGLPHGGPWWNLPGQTTTQARHALMTSMLQQAPQTKPGSTYAYSNVGYALAGLMAEQVTGESWENLMAKRLFEPLEMSSAGFGTPGRPGPGATGSKAAT